MSFAGAKFGRVCQLSVEAAPDSSGKAQTIVIGGANGIPLNEIKIEFGINRQSFISSQTATFRIFGLAPATRDAIFKDYFDWTQFRAIQFSAGYDTFMPMIFNGTVLQAYSEKDGPETVTVIEAFDGGFPITNGFANPATNASQRPATAVLQQLAASLPGTLGPPIVGSFPVTNQRGQVLSGNTWGLMQEISGGLATISDGLVYVLNINDGILNGQVVDITQLPASTPVPLISSQTGLLGAPRRSGLMVEWEMVFEPRLKLFQIVGIDSKFNPKFNGVNKVMGLRHQGVISKSATGEYRTTAKFYWGSGSFFSTAQAQAISP